MLTFLLFSINFTLLFSILSYLDFVHMHINDNNLKVVTIRILAFLVGCILALLCKRCV